MLHNNNTTFLVNSSIEFLIPEVDSSSIERLWWSEIIDNVLHLVVVQHPELLQLGPGDLQRREEVDPLDDLVTPRSGEGAVIGAVGGGGSPSYRGHPRHQVGDLKI